MMLLIMTATLPIAGAINKSKIKIESISTNCLQYELEMYPSHDTYIYERYPNTVHGQQNHLDSYELWVASHYLWDARTLLKFPIRDNLPSGVTIESARIELYMTVAPASSRTYRIHRILDEWSEHNTKERIGATWNNQPLHEPTMTDSIQTGVSTEVMLQWTVTSDVNGFLSGNFPNYGWMIKDAQEDSSEWNLMARFPSRENWDYFYKNYRYLPRLIIIYSYPQGTEPPTVEISGPQPGTVVTDSVIHLTGLATDDLYVEDFTWDVEWTGGTDIGPSFFIGYAHYQFDWEVEIHPGFNIITIRVDDSDGNVAFASTTVINTNAPNQPIITGKTSGEAGKAYVYSSSTTDPDGDTVEYLFDWGDNTDSGWVGPADSGAQWDESHIWTAKGDYVLRVKARDIWGVESVWSDSLIVTMPKNKSINPFFLNFLEQHPRMFPLLRQLLGLQ